MVRDLFISNGRDYLIKKGKRKIYLRVHLLLRINEIYMANYLYRSIW
jgi:hypothetical protein